MTQVNFKCKSECNPFNLTSSSVKDGCNASQISDECSIYVLGSTGLVVEHARWKKVMARYIGLRFHAATKVLVVAQELAKAKRF